MGAIKAYYHELLARHIAELEQDAYFDRLYEEWLQSQQAYAYEDNYEPFEARPVSNLTNVRSH